MITNEIRMDLNLDAGESEEALKNGSEEALYQIVTSVNIACGGHAGDERTMNEAIERARRRGLNIGAHPSFPDRENFGRKDLQMPLEKLSESIFQQIQSLREICEANGVRLSHVKPHGALYNLAASNKDLALCLIRTCQRIDPSLPLMGLAGSPFLRWVRQEGGTSLSEAFLDRRYERNGELRSRQFPDALIEDVQSVCEQARMIVLQEKVRAMDGTEIPLKAQTLCVHGDTPHALEFATQARQALEAAGVRIRPF